ncbi:hypothetical protein ALC56_05105 [Trachymyrmex septentrionalis]|uniref:Uncharacterized protein n=1 Tax=Trachymyrmex septentrionalis TaxID=34720 RepID=A0A195FIR6_9HYME|nr:hypothetical protein ALC56_05105 [Trachymyrmex septentrionalis]
MGRHAKRLIGMLLLRPRCINCAATTLEYTMHFDPSHTTFRCADAINAKYVLTVKEDDFRKICRGALFFIVAYVNVPRQCYKMSNTESRISHEALHEERLLLSDATEYLKQGQRVFENFTNYLIARQSTPISGYSVCTIKRCASQMRAVAREVFILRGVCIARVFRRCGKPLGRKKVDRHEKRRTTSKPQSYLLIFNRDGRFVERLHRSCSREAAFQWQETKSEVARVCSELNVHPQMCNVNTRTNNFDFVRGFVTTK